MAIIHKSYMVNKEILSLPKYGKLLVYGNDFLWYPLHKIETMPMVKGEWYSVAFINKWQKIDYMFFQKGEKLMVRENK